MQIKAELSTRFTESEVRVALDDCTVDLAKDFDHSSDVYDKLSLSLLAMEVEDLPDVLERLSGFQGRKHATVIAEIGDLLLANWVELDAVKGLLEEGLKKSDDGTRRVLLINGPKQKLAKLYALRALPDLLPKWRLLHLNTVFGEAYDLDELEDTLQREIKLEIENTFLPDIAEDGAQKEENQAILIRRCRRRVDQQRPIFITIQADGALDLLEELFRRISRKYGFATFIMRSRVEATINETPLGVIRPLLPSISPSAYDEFCELEGELMLSIWGEKNGHTR